MKIIISPAKKMKVDTDSLLWKDLPDFLPQTEQLLAHLKEKPPEELKKLWKCNDDIEIFLVLLFYIIGKGIPYEVLTKIQMAYQRCRRTLCPGGQAASQPFPGK